VFHKQFEHDKKAVLKIGHPRPVIGKKGTVQKSQRSRKAEFLKKCSVAISLNNKRLGERWKIIQIIGGFGTALALR
jgi:hypothetical protein